MCPDAIFNFFISDCWIDPLIGRLLLLTTTDLFAIYDLHLTPSAMGTTGALEPGTLAARPLGAVARQLNGANELWLATALSGAATQGLEPPQLAAVVASLVAPDVRFIPVWGSQWSRRVLRRA